MMENTLTISEEVLTMQREFDAGFAQPPRAQSSAPVNFLGIHLERDVYAVRATDITGLHADRRIMRLPSPVPTLLGVARFRGLVTPVYDLAALLGYAHSSTARWLMLVRLDANESIALAFDHFDTFFSTPQSNVITAPPLPTSIPESARTHLYDAVRTDDSIRPIIHLPSLQNTLPTLQKGST